MFNMPDSKGRFRNVLRLKRLSDFTPTLSFETGIVPRIYAQSSEVSVNANAQIVAAADTGFIGMFAHASPRVAVRYGITLGGWCELAAINQTGATVNGLMVGLLTAKPIVFGTNNAERMRIESDGKVGIGVTIPTEVVDVAGNAKVSGSVTAGTSVVAGTSVTAPTSVIGRLINASGTSSITVANSGNTLFVATPGGTWSGKVFLIDFTNQGGISEWMLAFDGNVGYPRAFLQYQTGLQFVQTNMVTGGPAPVLTANQVTLSWDGASGADTYRIYCGSNAGAQFRWGAFQLRA